MWRKILFPIAPLSMAISAVEYIIDNALRDTVTEPEIGSVLYCDLAIGLAEHSGVYLGNGEIIHLNGDGVIERVSPTEFMAGTTALNIYVSCDGSYATGCSSVAHRAKTFESDSSFRDYNVLLDNCHQFTSACLTGDIDNTHSFLWMLKDECSQQLGVNCWRVWSDP